MKKQFAVIGVALLGFASVSAHADGAAVYNSGCMACHTTGVAGSPKIGDKEAWVERIAQGMDLLYEHAIVGFQGKTGFMPPKGGFAHLSDDDVKLAVDHMVEQSQ
ncbi:MAG: c-type cytochrome [Arenicellales bacterium]|nr:c-type cytochrome [Arenicellales bacterium]MDP6552048.1 c-type cytochrome [Arenicellales bacterium]MDP6791560.1 c-type cytochrome [Arenicellales bacterium]MDP6917994.1 c-type cytochrome [Arenicellales bacterium]